MNRPTTLLIIAGSDSGGCAGIQADLRVSYHLQCHGVTAITALTAQNTQKVESVYPLSGEIVEDQLEAIMDDFTIDAVKIGMLFNQEIIETVTNFCRKHASLPIVLDPVCIATSGDLLLEDTAINGLVRDLIPYATLITPNLSEYQILLNHGFTLEYTNTLITGGDEGLKSVTDLLHLMSENTPTSFTNPKINTFNTHGSGCSLSTAIAVSLARGYCIKESVARAIALVHQGINMAKSMKITKGNGPLCFYTYAN